MSTSLPAAIPRLAGLPIVGNLVQFRRDRLALQRRLTGECGDIAVVRVGPVSVVAVSSAELAQQVLVEHADAFIKSRGLQIARIFLGDGLLTSEHQQHRRQRKLMAPVFAHRRIASYATAMVARAERTARLVQAAASDGAPVDVAEQMMRLTLAIVGETLFSSDIEGDAREVGVALTAGIRYINDMLTHPLRLPLWVPTPGNLTLRRALAGLDAIIYRLIREHREADRDLGDMLSMLLLARDESGANGMSDLQIRDEAMTVFLAGHETTANALSWAFYLLARHPECRAALEEEADRVLGGRSATVDNLPRLPYAMQVFKETLRLYPPAYVVGRSNERAVRLGDHDIPPGTVVFVNIYGMHHRADYFADPERFDPGRFAPEREKQLRPLTFLPFGGGPRICIGNHFALMEGQLLLATLAQRVRFSLAPGQHVEPEPLITLRPRGGIPMFAHARSPSHAVAAEPLRAGAAASPV